MATIDSNTRALMSEEVLSKLGRAMEQFAVEFDPTNGPEVWQTSTRKTEDERSRFSESGISAFLLNWSVDEMRVNERREAAFRDGVFEDIIPADASTWDAGFDVWGGFSGMSWQHSYLRVSSHGSDYVGLRSFSPVERIAVEMMKAALTVLREFPAPEPGLASGGFRVFVAYGGGRAWEVVRDYLRRAEISVEAFTEVERAGSVTLDVVSEMIHSASMAVIVMTGTDEMADGSKRARQNVIHETGFAQGALGTRNTIILLEQGVEPPSNIAGVTYIPFAPGEIHTTEERVLSLLRSRMQARGGI